MADVSDVGSVLVGLIAGLLYPNGTAQPSAVGANVQVFAGWPDPSKLDADLKAGNAQVSVYPRPDERNVTRYRSDWMTLSTNTPTLALIVDGQTVTVEGAVPPASAGNPQNLALLVNGQPYVYAVQPTDTLAKIAAALAVLLMPVFSPVNSAGPVITLPRGAQVSAARVGITGLLVREVRRQDKLFQITIWAPTPAIRTALAKIIDPVLASTYFLTLPDGSSGRLRYRSNTESDQGQKQLLYRRDLLYSVEYPTLQTLTGTEVIVLRTLVEATAPDGSVIPVATINQ